MTAPALINPRNNSKACESFLLRVLPRSGYYNVSGLDAQKKFSGQYANSVRNAVSKALEIDEAGNDAFFATASYLKMGSRKADNVLWAKSFWIDIDCGEEKAAEGKGYAGKRGAVLALQAFCLASGLPIPTIVDSGGGLHCYWILDQEITAAEWLPIAKKLKQIMALGATVLLADSSRTTDIASVLRVPGTRNRKPKYNNPIVKILRESKDVDLADFSYKIDAAYAKLPLIPQQSGDLSNGQEKCPPPPETTENIERVKSMLAVLDADCDYGIWRNIGWALASLNWKCGYELFEEWSKTAPDRYDSTEVFKIWNSYRKDGGVCFGTLRYLAKEAGWIDPCASSKDTAVLEFNERYRIIESEAGIFDIQQSHYVSERGFHLLNANKKINIGTAEKPNLISLSRYWLEHKDRRQHTELTLAPGQPQITVSNQLNVWAGFSVPSIQGDVSLFLELAEQLIPDASDRKYVRAWLARLIQNPAEKFHVALVVWSAMQGTGKNLFFESVGRILHELHSGVIGQEAFTDQFTEWHSHKVLLIADEVSAAGDRKTADRIKVLLTATKNSINVKNAPKYEEPNLTKWVLLSNHPDAAHMKDADRRYYVVEASRTRLPTEFADLFVRWRDNGGLSAIRHYLESYDTSRFNPKAPAPMTKAKAEMIEDNRSDLERWLHGILTAESISSLLGREICTAEELTEKYKNASRNSASSKAISNALAGEGVRRLSKQARCKNGKRPRVYALCNIDRWESKTEMELGAEMDKPFIHFGG